MKRIFALVLSACLLLVVSVPLAGATEGNENNSPVLNERVTSILEENNIDFQISDGNLKLVDTSPEGIVKVNKLLVSEFKASLDAKAAAAYPTPYTHMKQYDLYDSHKFQVATEIALAAAVTEWAKSKFKPDPYKMGVAAAAGFGVYYFINRNVEDLYFGTKYYYRELGAGFFDANGNFIGDYEILKEIRVTKNSDYTGGSLTSDARRSSIVEPWF